LDDSGNLWKCLFGSDLTYLGNNADLYKFENSEGNRPYELIRNEELDDYSNLARLIDIINNTPQTDFEDSLESIIDVISILKYFAANILVGGWDDYWSLSNNFYLYHNPALDEFSLIPYDYDNTFGITWWDIDWSGVNPYTFSQIYPGPRPLVNRIMQTPKYRNLFTHFLEFYSENYFNTDFFYNGLENLKTKIQTYAENDTFRLADWGFTTEHFLRSFSEPDFYYENDIIVPESIRDFVLNRTISLKSQLNYINFAPIIYDFSLSQTHLLSDQNLEIRSSIFSNQGIDSVKVEVSIKDEGTYFKEMNYIPQNASFYVEENDLWTVELPPFGESKQAFIRIIAKDKLGNISSYPENGIQIYTASAVSNEILINELMSNNVNTYSDEAGEYDDWIELFNPTDAQIDLSEKYLTDKKDNLTKWKIPQGMIINANEYLIFWCDEDQEQGNNHTNFRLSSEGEFIALVDSDGISIIDSLTFPAISQDNSYARNDGHWEITSSATPGANNIITSVTDKIAADFQINIAAFPNPFNPGTTISYELPKKLDVKVGIFDVLGREVWNIELKNQEAGSYEIDWNGADVSGKKLSSGIYFARIFGRSFSETVKLIILR
jgi:hypothetical protein